MLTIVYDCNGRKVDVDPLNHTGPFGEPVAASLSNTVETLEKIEEAILNGSGADADDIVEHIQEILDSQFEESPALRARKGD